VCELCVACDARVAVAELHKMLEPHLLRRLKSQVMKELPEKQEFVVRVDMTPLQVCLCLCLCLCLSVSVSVCVCVCAVVLCVIATPLILFTAQRKLYKVRC
jgi:hypothetical protein